MESETIEQLMNVLKALEQRLDLVDQSLKITNERIDILTRRYEMLFAFTEKVSNSVILLQSLVILQTNNALEKEKIHE